MASMFLKEEKFCDKMVYYTSCLGSVKSCRKVRIYVDKKPFLKEACHFKCQMSWYQLRNVWKRNHKCVKLKRW